MSVSLTAIKCPACGASLPVESDRESLFCSYCGSKVMITNENVHVYRNIDEARIREAEIRRMIMMREMEIEEKNSISRKYLILIWIVSTAILLILGIIGFTIDNEGLGMCMMLAMLVGMYGGLGLFSNKKKKKRRYISPDDVRINESMESYRGKNFNAIAGLYKTAGFSNVKTIPLGDLTIFNQNKNGQVESVTINGNDDFEEGDVFPVTSTVLITYHSKG